MKPKIIADINIPFLKGVFDDAADISYLSAPEITPDKVRDADALIIRTRTICNKALLGGSRVRLIATATIGTDHIDTGYCDQRGIRWANAPGCNARSVAQYVAAAAAYWAENSQNPGFENLSPYDKLKRSKIGIIGYGHVGKAVHEYMGLHSIPTFLICDPPLQRWGRTPGTNFCPLRTIAEQCDIITLHVPLTFNGGDATHHLIDRGFFNQLKRRPLIINAARGGVVNEDDLLDALDDNKVGGCVVDCWENEPDINLRLLDKTLLSTPHIAGYSADGKLNATKAAVRFIEAGLNIQGRPTAGLPEMPEIMTSPSMLPAQWLEAYAIDRDSRLLKDNPSQFELIRGSYPIRRETKFR